MPRLIILAGLLSVALCLTEPTKSFAQDAAPGDTKPALVPANPGDQVVLKREAAQIQDASRYRTALVLEPVQQLVLTAPCDGIIREVSAKVNSTVAIQAELARLENTEQKLLQARAESLFKVATIEQKLASKDELPAQLAQAKLDAAKADLELARYRFDQTNIRAPFAGEVLQVFVTAGQAVKAGDPIAKIGNRSQMVVEVPVDRTTVEVGKPFPLKVDAGEVTGNVDSLFALSPRFDPLRDLYDSVASARITIENPEGKLQPGQTVYVPLIPRLPIVEVAAGAVANTGEGDRKVQVIRGLIVRDVPVQVLAGIGSARTFVSGAFLPGDEIIFETSHLLADGFQLQPASLLADSVTPTQPGTRRPAVANPSNDNPNRPSF